MIASRFCAAIASLLVAFAASSAHAARDEKSWAEVAKLRLQQLDQKHPGQVGVYVRDLRTNVVLALRGEEPWYIASGSKVPIAIAALQQVEEGKLALDTRLRIEEDDYLDGAGNTNYHASGKSLPVRFLLEQMIVHSDNTASDVLIRKVGLKNVNASVKRLAPRNFGPITTLSSVRQRVYGHFHPAASVLKNRDFIHLKKLSSEREKVEYLDKLLDKTHADNNKPAPSLDVAYEAYYKERLNTASLKAYVELLSKVLSGRALKPASRDHLLTLLSNTQTGHARIKSGLPRKVTFAHKTGTQHRRLCDFGIIRDESREQPNIAIVAACTRGFASSTEAESALKSVGEILASSGILE